jgi:nicotinamide riboside kinase
MQEVKKIVIIGPESTGKSTLCKQLAAHYNTLWCPEYAREYLHENGTDYTYNDLLEIAKGQLRLEEEFLEKVNGQWAMGNRQWAIDNRQSQTSILKPQSINHQPPTTNYQLLFIDTNMYVMKVWCEFVFEKCHQLILDEITIRKYDLYLLCNIDLPWVEDELREYPDLESREKLYHIYKDILINQEVPWAEISGNYDHRLHHAVTAVDKLISFSPA